MYLSIENFIKLTLNISVLFSDGDVSMEKIMKITAILLVMLIIASSITLGAESLKEDSFDFFGYKDIVNNVKNLEVNMTSIVYVKNKDGKWEEYQRIHGEENRIWVDLEKIPQTLIDAFISIEDERYFSHVGVDWKRTTSAFLNQFVNIYSSNQGGSTITQQLIKNLTGDKKQNAKRKLREIARAILIEKKLNKNQILESYLNTISLGNGICGVQVAANYYFNKDVSELTLLECASIAGITKNPSAYNPEDKPEANKQRSKTVLKKMYECEKITYDQYMSAQNQELMLDDSQRDNLEAPVNNYFIDTLISNVVADLSEKYNCSEQTASAMLYNGGYKIYSTVDLGVQEIMEKYYNNMKYFSQKSSKTKKNVQSAMTIMDYEGHIIGVVGGVGEKTVNRGLNRAVDSPRQPGSTMKPIGVYAPAIDSGVCTYSSVYVDSPLDNYYPDGKKGPAEWYGEYLGNMSIQKALERSANTIPCKVLQEMGIENSYKFLTEKLGFKHLNEIDKNLASLALGGCNYGITTTESAAAYAIFGNGGKYYKPVTYTVIKDATGKTILKDGKSTQAIKPATATIMHKLLQNVVYGASGTGRGIASYSKMKAYAKTGTSSESNDLWMVAGTPYYVGSVWYGFDQPQQIWNQSAAATLWKGIMKDVHKDLEIKEFQLSEDVVEQKYCAYTGKIAGKKCSWKKDGIYVPDIEAVVCDGKHSGGAPDTKKPKESSEEEVSSSSTPTPSSTPATPSTPSAPSTPSKPEDNNSAKPETPSTPETPPAEQPSKPESSSPSSSNSSNTSSQTG